jgi:hypothetical protein
MDAGRTDASPPSGFPASASSTDSAAGSVGNGHAFKTQTADYPDKCGGASNTRGRATMARRHALNVFGFAWRWPGPSVVQATTRSGSTTATSRAVRSASGSIGDFDGPAGAPHRIPLSPPLRFLPLMYDAAPPPLVIPHGHASHGDASSPEARADAWPGRRACSWPRHMISAMAYRLRYWTTPGEHRKALRMAHSREKVIGAAYVFLNAMQSDEPLVRHFAALQRQVRRLDKRAGMAWGISDESALVLREAADRTACAREKVRDKILSFHREELLYDAAGTDEFHRADGILLVLESRMATGVALYGHALRCIAATDVSQDAVCETIGQVLETVFAREAAAGTTHPRDWLGCAVSRLPYRTLERLHAVLSAGLVCGGAYQAFLDELARIVESKMGTNSTMSD